uniref:Alternative protein SLC12A3 n=1 Tax=Homo sapiens TaxID=9606 RepID=L8E783_HUMAN|nr:alternative protein SLC12A3 [Homo sapiens]
MWCPHMSTMPTAPSLVSPGRSGPHWLTCTPSSSRKADTCMPWPLTAGPATR